MWMMDCFYLRVQEYSTVVKKRLAVCTHRQAFFFSFVFFPFSLNLAQSTTGPIIPASTCGTYSYMCQEYAELHPLGATVVTVGVNVGGYSGAALDVHFKEVASREEIMQSFLYEV